jgi:hypothetical protein
VKEGIHPSQAKHAQDEDKNHEENLFHNLNFFLNLYL